MAEPTRWKQIEMAAKKPQAEVQWMAQPQALIGCPPGLEYLVQIDRLLVQQQVELLECQSEQESEVHVVLANDIDFQVSSCILDLLTACYYSKVLSANGTQPVGKISKQWSSLVKEYFTDADNFGIQCMAMSMFHLMYIVLLVQVVYT